MSDVVAWEALRARSQPIPCEPERGHVLGMAEWRVVDGGVVVWRYQAFCRCYWSQMFPTGDRQVALDAYARHVKARR